jgi:hypothetical protein
VGQILFAPDVLGSPQTMGQKAPFLPRQSARIAHPRSPGMLPRNANLLATQPRNCSTNLASGGGNIVLGSSRLPFCWRLTFMRTNLFIRNGREQLAQIADWAAVGVAISLPWSTSATSILLVLWLITLLPTLNVAMVRREIETPAGGLPVLLWLLAAIGMLWAEVSWAERVHGLDGFNRLLVIPLLLAQFRRSEHGPWVLYGFLASAVILLLA